MRYLVKLLLTTADPVCKSLVPVSHHILWAKKLSSNFHITQVVQRANNKKMKKHHGNVLKKMTYLLKK